MDLYFLTLEDTLEIHADQIKRYGGKEGIRDQQLLFSALAQPSNMFEGKYLHQSLYDKASAYLFHICQNHPFIDGNKRVALVSTLIFLDLNHHSINYNQEQLEDLVLSVAKGKIKKEKIAAFLIKSRA